MGGGDIYFNVDIVTSPKNKNGTIIMGFILRKKNVPVFSYEEEEIIRNNSDRLEFGSFNLAITHYNRIGILIKLPKSDYSSQNLLRIMQEIEKTKTIRGKMSYFSLKELQNGNLQIVFSKYFHISSYMFNKHLFNSLERFKIVNKANSAYHKSGFTSLISSDEKTKEVIHFLFNKKNIKDIEYTMHNNRSIFIYNKKHLKVD